MKFIVSSNSLLKQLQSIAGVIGSNTVLPILEDFLFEIEARKLTITATDLETVMRTELEIEAKESGKVCIPAKILIDSLKNIPEQPLAFSVDKNFGIEITSDNGKYKVMGENPDNFPKEPLADDTTSFSIASSALLRGINKTLFATSTDDMRPAMTGVFFELSEENIRFVATDAHRLVQYTRTDVSCPTNGSFIVPRKPLNLLKTNLPDSKDEVLLNYNNSHLFVKYGVSQMICRLIDGRFPDYRVVMPTDNPYKLIVNRLDMSGALRRVTVFSNKSTYQVSLTITGSELQLESQDVDFSFEGNERMNCQYDGEDLAIAFNGKFLIELLGATDSQEVFFELSTSSKAGLIKPMEQDEQEQLTMLLMPLMLGAL